MKLDDAFVLAGRVHELTGHRELVVIGSNAILGLEPYARIPDTMSMSCDLDAYLKDDPDRTGELVAELGEGSPFHRETGTFLDVVSPALVTAPEDWPARMLRVDRSGLTVWFLDPVDAAVAKLARGEARDLRWLRSGIQAGLISLPLLAARVSETVFLDQMEERMAAARVQTLSPSSSPDAGMLSVEPDLGPL